MKIAFFLFVLFVSYSAKGQTAGSAPAKPDDRGDSSKIVGHVYHVNFWTSIAVTVGTGLATFAGSRLPRPDIIDISNQEFDAAQTTASENAINPIDRWSLRLGLNSFDYTNVAATFQTVCAALPLTLFFGERFRKNWDDIILMMAEVNAVNMFMFQFSPFGPFFQKRFRPVVYYAVTPEQRDQIKTGSNRVSFYSGHEAAAAVSLFFMAKVYCDYHPEIEGWGKIGIYALASIPPLTMGYLRIIALRHWLSDVLVGGAVGGTIGIVIPELHRITGNNLSFGAHSSPSGTGLDLTWNLR